MVSPKRRILVVDDDPTMVRLAEKFLMNDGYMVSIGKNGAEALNSVRGEIPDLILLDVLMPDMMGVEVASILQEESETKDIPIIFMTVTINLDKDKGSELIDVHGKKYRAFAKPVHQRKLLNTIRKEINKRVNKN